MSQARSATRGVELHVENIGGIDETSVEFSPGVNVLTGRNATNRTSLLQALMAVLGSDRATLKADAEEGRVDLTVGDTTYTRRLRREGGTIVTDGDPYLDDATLADLFAFLLEQNDARQAVASGANLRDVIMRPIDTDQLQDEIRHLETERQEIDSQLEEISSLKQRLPDLEGRRADIESRIQEKREELAATEAEIDAIDSDVQAHRDQKDELESKLEELNNIRSQLETVRRKIDTHEESIEALEEERTELEADREAYDAIPDDRIEEITSEVRRLRRELDTTEITLDKLQTVIEFNEEVLDGSVDLFTDLQDEEDDEAVTDQLVEDGDDLVCWTCGSEVDADTIESMLDRLRSLRTQTMEQHNDLKEQIDNLEGKRIELEEQKRQHKQINTRLDTIEPEIQEHEEQIADLEERRSNLTDQVDQLETEIEELRTDDQSELLDLHTEANRLEFDIDRLEDDLQDVEAEIARLEEQITEEEQLESRRKEIQCEIESLRTRVERLEHQAIDEFNDHMEEILDILEFENLERIWIERIEQEVREGRQQVMKGKFDLHIVRSTESGTVYEDTIEHLSESEREVTGLVFALAGYLAHDLYEEAPFMLLDSLEALDSNRIAALVDYFRDYVEYVVVALLPEDANALDSDYQRITEI